MMDLCLADGQYRKAEELQSRRTILQPVSDSTMRSWWGITHPEVVASRSWVVRVGIE